MRTSESAISRCLNSLAGEKIDGRPDSEILDSYLADRNPFAFELLVWRHYMTVYRTCRAVTRDHHLAEDGAQAAFMVLAKKAESIRDKRNVVGWLHTIAYRISIRMASDASRNKKIDMAEIQAEGTPTLEAMDIGIDVHEQLIRLSDKYRVPLILCYFEGLSHVEAANRLGLSLGIFNARVLQAKKMLERRLRKEVVGAVLAAFFTVNQLSPCTAGTVARVSSVACRFATGGLLRTEAVVSSTIARGIVGQMKQQAYFWIVKYVIILAIATGAAVSIDLRRPTLPVAERVVAPKPLETPGLPEDVINEFEAMGAVYGGFCESENDIETIFIPGQNAANVGIPGFCWTRTPDKKLVREAHWPTKRFGVCYECDISEDEIIVLAKCGSLHTLVLNQSLISDTAFRSICANKSLRSLTTHLPRRSLARPKAKGAVDTSMSALLTMENLEFLAISGVTLAGPSEVTEVEVDNNDGKKPGLKNLKSLSIDYRLGAEYSNLTDWLLHPELLQRLRIRVRQGQHAYSLRGVESCVGLRSISLQGCPEDRMNDKSGDCIRNLQNLEMLKLTGRSIDLLKLGSLAELKQLKSIDLSNRENGLTVATSRPLDSDWIEQLATLRQLEKLRVETDEKITAENLRQISKLTLLRELSLKSDRWERSAMDRLIDLPENLRTLVIQSPILCDQHLENLTRLRNLSSFGIIHANISQKGIAALKPISSLRTLDMYQVTTTEESLVALAELTQLRSISLSVGFSSPSKGLRKIFEMANLESVAVPYAIPIEIFDGLHPSSHLVRIELAESTVNSHNDKLRATFPKCLIRSVQTKVPVSGGD